MNYYVLRPDLTPYEGIVVTKETKLEFKNENVEEKLENLELVITRKETDKKYEVESKMTLHLEEGEVLLFEKENRGYFLPAEPIGTIDVAISDLRGLAASLDGVDYKIIKEEK